MGDSGHSWVAERKLLENAEDFKRTAKLSGLQSPKERGVEKLRIP